MWANPLFTGRNFIGRDMLPYNLPTEKTIHAAYASGHLPVWNPWISGGRPLLPNPNAGALYPVRPILSVLSFPLAMRVYPILHWIAAGIGILFLCRALGAGRDAAWIAAATYVFSGASISDSFYPHILPGFALMPWILWAFQRSSRTPLRGALLLGTLFGLDFLAGDVFTCALAVGVCVLWMATESASAGAVRSPNWRDLVPAVQRLGVAIILGGLLAAPQILATALWIPETNRSVLGLKIGDATLFSVSPLRLLEFLIPFPFGNSWELRPSAVWGWGAFNGKAYGLFVTLYAGALAPLCVWRMRRAARPGLAFARWLLGLSLAACILPTLFPKSWNGVTSPVALRNPEKLVIGAVFALAIFAAWGFEEFRKRPLARRAGLGVGAGFAVAAAAAAIWPHFWGDLAGRALGALPRHAAVAAVQIPGSLAEAGLLWMATVIGLEMVRSSSPRRRTAIAGLALLAAVPAMANRRLVEISDPQAAFSPTTFALRVRRADPGGAFRVLGEEIYRNSPPGLYVGTDLAAVEQPWRAWTFQTPALWNLGTVLNADFDSGDLARVESLRKVSAWPATFRDSAPFFGNLSLRFGIRKTIQPPVSAFRRIGGDPLQDWDELSPASADIRLATEWREEANPLAALSSLPKMAAGELLLETGRAASGRARPGTLKILEKSPGRLRILCDAPDPTWLFVLRDFWSHRTVEIDGGEVDAVPAYLAFSAVPIPAGRHRVEWRERIPGIALSKWGPVFFLLAAVAAFRPKAARPVDPDSPPAGSVPTA